MSKTIITLNRQDAFNRAWEGLMGQKFAKCSFKDGGGCSYDGTEGKKCAWGWVDPEGTKDRVGRRFNPFTETMEDYREQVGGSVHSIAEQGIGLAAYLSPSDLEFASALQQAHDQSANPNDMRARMVQVALDHKLTVPGLDPVALEKARQAIDSALVLDRDAAQRAAIAVTLAFAA